MIKICNNSDLSYEKIGKVVDQCHIGNARGIYEEKEDELYFEINERHYKVVIKYSVKNITFTITNVIK